MTDSCCYPHCQSKLSETISIELCDRHALKTYRRVQAAMKLAQHKDRSIKSLAEGHGSIYVVRLGNRIKIGFTTNVTQRFREIPHEEVIGTFRGSTADEKRLHKKFESHRIVREWFNDCPEIRDYFAAKLAARQAHN